MDKDIILMTFINIFILLFAPFFVLGVIRKTKAFWGARKGAPILQPFYDFLKLTKKNRIISNSTSFVFNIAPIVVLIGTIVAGLFVPMVNAYSIINIAGAFIIFSYILGLSKFFLLICAMDTASSFEGMGASREACFTTIIEPAFFLILASIIVLSGNMEFSSITKIIQNAEGFGVLIIIFAFLTLFIMLLTEGSRVPVDDPATHLELTMIHEVMILDNSGIDLAMLTWASGIKMLILMSLIVNLIIPYQEAWYIGLLYYFIAILLLSICIGTIESAIARFRMTHIFEFIFVMSSFALVGASLVLVKMFGV